MERVRGSEAAWRFALLGLVAAVLAVVSLAGWLAGSLVVDAEPAGCGSRPGGCAGAARFVEEHAIWPLGAAVLLLGVAGGGLLVLALRGGLRGPAPRTGGEDGGPSTDADDPRVAFGHRFDDRGRLRSATPDAPGGGPPTRMDVLQAGRVAAVCTADRVILSSGVQALPPAHPDRLLAEAKAAIVQAHLRGVVDGPWDEARADEAARRAVRAAGDGPG